MLYQLPRRPTEWQLILVYLNCILVRSELPSSTEHHFCFIWTSVGLAFISIFFSSGYFKGGKKITRAASCCPRRSTGGILGHAEQNKDPSGCWLPVCRSTAIMVHCSPMGEAPRWMRLVHCWKTKCFFAARWEIGWKRTSECEKLHTHNLNFLFQCKSLNSFPP